jgi:hypothetical protein
MPAEFQWTGYGRAGKHTPVPGEALDTYECLACESILTPESDPEEDCPGRANQSNDLNPNSPNPGKKEHP